MFELVLLLVISTALAALLFVDLLSEERDDVSVETMTPRSTERFRDIFDV